MLIQQLMSALRQRMRAEQGQSMVEYGLIIALIAVVVVGVLATLGHQINGVLCQVWVHLGGSGTCP